MNGTMMQYFEWDLPADASLWRQVSENAQALSDAGITALWLPPAYKDNNGKNGVGYAVYDLYDLGEFDQKGSIPTKYGTKDEYLQAILDCHAAGIAVYGDIVLNHRIGADAKEEVDVYECSGNNRSQITSAKERISAWTRFTFPGRNGKYSDFTWQARHFDGIDWDDNKKRSSIYLIDGKSWENDVDGENGNYDYLMGADLDFGQPDVVDELIRWGKWYMDFTHVDGFRLDAVKHIQSDFYKRWLTEMRTYGRQEYFTVGEYWNGDTGRLLHYLDELDNTLSLFDVPLHYHFFDASKNPDRYDLRMIFDNTLVQQRPMNAVTFVDNHDTQPGQALCSFVEAWFKPLAYALILLREAGYPCVFYGDYYGMPEHSGSPVGRTLSNLLSVRQTHAYGCQHDYFDAQRCIGFTREGLEGRETETGLACVLSSGGDDCKRMYVGSNRSGQKFFDVTRNVGSILSIDNEGYGLFPVRSRSVSVWIPI